MGFLLNITISAVMLIAAFNIPANWLNVSHYFASKNFGGTFTTLTGANTLSTFPTTYNNNLTLTPNLTTANTYTALQNYTNASSTLFSCTGTCYFGGTATSTFSSTGALTLATKLTVPNGGTASTTLSINQVLLGNGANAIGIVSGYGTSGQLLTSNGSGGAPTWTTVTTDPTANYNWTGTYFGVKNFLASSTVANPITLNTLTYNLPSIRGAASSSLEEDGSGNLSWVLTPKLLYSSGAVNTTGTTATTTVFNFPVPANMLAASSTILFTAYVSDMNNAGNSGVYNMDFGYGNATTSCQFTTTSNNDGQGEIHLAVTFNKATNSQLVSIALALLGTTQDSFNATTASYNCMRTVTGSVDATVAQSLMFQVKPNGNSARLNIDQVVGTLMR